MENLLSTVRIFPLRKTKSADCCAASQPTERTIPQSSFAALAAKPVTNRFRDITYLPRRNWLPKLCSTLLVLPRTSPLGISYGEECTKYSLVSVDISFREF